MMKQLQKQLCLSRLLSGSIMELEDFVPGDGHGFSQTEMRQILTPGMPNAQLVSQIRLILSLAVSGLYSLNIMVTILS